MRCIIIEDQPPAQRILKKYIEGIESLDLRATFSDGIKAIEFLKSEEVELIFLDIHLPRLSGLDFLKSLINPPHVILTTAFPNYALESYEFSVIDYLLKPFSFQRFLKAVSKVPVKELSNTPVAESSKSVRKELFIKSGYEHIKIALDDIFFIKSDSDYTEIHLPDKKHLSSEPLRYWHETLDHDQFVRIHKSFIINADKIVKVSGNRVFLGGKIEIPIGRAYKDSFAARFLNNQ